MADKNEKWVENVVGRYYVDRNCIACDACCIAAPDNFRMHDDGHSYLVKQPTTVEEEKKCQEALLGCPVEAIGDDNEVEEVGVGQVCKA